MAYTVGNLLNTSCDDLKSTLAFITDLQLLQRAHHQAAEQGMVTKTLLLERRIKQLRKEAQA